CLAGITVKVSPTVDVIKGQTAQLPCSYTGVEGSTAPLVQWFIDSAGTRKRVAFRSSADSAVDKATPLTERIVMEPNMTLVITNTNAADEMSFYCRVTAGLLGHAEEATQLRIFYAPEKPVVTGNTQINIGDELSSVVGTCTSSNGHPKPRIIWFKDATPLPEVTDPKDETYMVPRVVRESSGLFTVSSVLYMKPKKEDAKSDFHCTVEYMMPNGQIQQESSETFKLTLHYPAENLMFNLVNQEPIKEGDEVKMKCESDGNPQPQFDFFKGEKKLSSDTGLLKLKGVTRNDAGTYRCEALDFETFDTLKTELTLDVHYLDPVSIVPSEPLVIEKGRTLELQCTTKSSDRYTLGDKVLSRNGALTVESVTLADAGVYKCNASVPTVRGLEKQANTTVKVRGKPEIEEPVKAEVKKLDDTVTLRCSALGYPSPQFTWTASGKESVIVEGHKTIGTLELAATEKVLLEGVACEASNDLGTDTKRFMVQVKSENNADSRNHGQAESRQGGSGGVVIAVVVCVLLLLLMVAALYFLSKKGIMSCGKKDKNKTATGQADNKEEQEGLKSMDQCSVGHPLVLNQWSRDAAHGTLPTGRCPRDAAHGTLPTGRCWLDDAPEVTLRSTICALEQKDLVAGGENCPDVLEYAHAVPADCVGEVEVECEA
ncbi:hypothetical protein NFI96_029333, partial [Prochilodus magdalenae]